MRTQRFMLSGPYVEAMSHMTTITDSGHGGTIFLHRSLESAYKPATTLTDWEQEALKDHVNYFLRRNYMNGIFHLKATPEGWYIEKVQLAPTKETATERQERIMKDKRDYSFSRFMFGRMNKGKP